MGCGAAPKAAAPKTEAADAPKPVPTDAAKDAPKPEAKDAPTPAATDSPKHERKKKAKPEAQDAPKPADSPKGAAGPARGGYSDQHGILLTPDAGKARGGYEAASGPPLASTAAAPAPPKPCLYYYPFAGRGELSRLITAAGGLEIDENIELVDKTGFGSPGTWPCLEHESLKISQSFAIESYLARISPGFKELTPIQRGEDAMFCKLKEELISGFVAILSIMMADDSQRATGVKDIAALGDRWFPIVEGRLPTEGFIHGLAFPTTADLVVLNVARGFMPFGAAYLMGEYDILARFPKFARHVDLVASFPIIKAYLEKSTTMDCDPMGLRPWELKDEAIRIFGLADKDGSGAIDLSELANLRNSQEFAHAMMGEQDENRDGKLSLDEWLQYTKKIFDKKASVCKAMLKLYDRQIGQNKEIKLSDWALKDEAIRIFRLADQDGSGFLDLGEVANLRNSKEFADAMMDAQDADRNGKLSLPEWLSYVEGLFDKKEASCKAVLKLYERQIGENRDIKLQSS